MIKFPSLTVQNCICPFYSLLALVCVSGSTAHSQQPTPAPAVIFHDVFAAGSPDVWKIDKGDQPFGEIKRSTEAAAPGLLVTAPGRETATTEWQAGIDAFDFWFDVDLTAGTKQAWRYNGVVVALSSAPIGEMTANDVVFSTGFHQAGVRSAIAQGPFYKPGADIKKAPKFQNSQVSKRFEVNMAGAGGEYFSIRWPKKTVNGMKLRCRIQRLPENKMRFEVYNAEGNWSKPWWVGEAAIPANLSAIPIRYVSVITTEDNPDSSAPVPAVAQVSGRISAILGWTGDSTARPAITGYTAGPNGAMDAKDIAVTGANFSKGTTVLINGTACQTQVLSATQLKAIATGLNKEGVNRLQVIDPNGLFASYEAGIYAGLYLDHVEPREEPPAGGGVVTVHGGGFDASTKVSFNGKPVEVVGVPLSDSIQVKAPPGEAGVITVTAIKTGQSFTGSPAFGYAPHPYLLFKGKEGLEAVKKRFNDPGFTPYRKAILAETDKAIATLSEPKTFTHGGFGEPVIGATFAYCMTGDPKYKEAALKCYHAQFEGDNGEITFSSNEWNYPGSLKQSLDKDEFLVMNGIAFALMYDALFDQLTPEMRANLERYLTDHMDYYKSRIAAGDWWYGGNPSNTIPVGSGGGGTVALALRYSTPGSDEVIDTAVTNIKKFYKAIQDDGGCVEGNMYWNYGLGAQLAFGLYLQNGTGSDKGILGDPKFPKMVDFVATQIGGDGNMFTFNDTEPWINGGIPEALAESHFDQPLMRWACDEIARRVTAGTQEPEVGRPSYIIPTFLFRDSKPMLEKIPDLPTAAFLNVLNWGVLRSSPQAVGSGLVVGVKGVGGIQTHHAEEDAGSFVVQSQGESFLIDPGYYQATAIEHTLSVIGDFKEVSKEGEILNPRATAPLSDMWEAGTLRSITEDSTASYKTGNDEGRARLARRVLVLNDDKTVIALDQVEPYNPSDKITSFYQCGFATTKLPNGNGFRIEGKNSDLAAVIDGPQGDLSIEGPVKWKQQWVFAKSGVQWYRVRAPYTFTPDQPRITVILPLGKGQPVPQVNIQRTGDSISILVPGAKPVSFKKDGNLWKAVKSV